MPQRYYIRGYVYTAGTAQNTVARSASTERPVVTHAVQLNEEQSVAHKEPSSTNESQAQPARRPRQVRLRGQQQRRGGILPGALPREQSVDFFRSPRENFMIELFHLNVLPPLSPISRAC